MIYPKYLNNGSTIGVTACSAGVLKKIEKYEKSINKVRSVRNENHSGCRW